MTKRMSREQLRYAQDRLYSIRTAELNTITEQCKLPREKGTTFGEFIKGIKSGKFKLKDWKKPEDEIGPAVAVAAVFDIVAHKGYDKYDEKKRTALTKQHEKKWQDIEDKLMLGDATEVLNMIKELESGSST